MAAKDLYLTLTEETADRLCLLEMEDDDTAMAIRLFWVNHLGKADAAGHLPDARRLLAEGDHLRAAAVLAAVRIRRGPVLDWLLPRMNLSLQQGDVEGVRSALARVRIAPTDRVLALERLVKMALAVESVPEALAFLGKALVWYPEAPMLHKLRVETLALGPDDGALLDAVDEAVARLDRDPGLWVNSRLAAVQDKARLVATMQRAAKGWPDSGLGAAAARLLRDGAPIDGATGVSGMTALLGRAARAAMTGNHEKLEAVLARLPPPPPGPKAERIALRLEAIRGLGRFRGDLRRPVVVMEPGKDVLVSARGDSGATVVAYCGLGQALFVPVNIIDFYLARRGVSAIYLMDSHKSGFAAGVAGLAANREQRRLAVRRQLDELGTERVLTVGSSAGGGTAVGDGLFLEAAGVLSFSGIYTADPVERRRLGDDRAPLVARRAHDRLQGDVHLPDRFAGTSHRPQMHLYFAEDAPIDRGHAELLAGFENVSLFEVPAPCGHGSAWRPLPR